jgi:hypothetical protein
MPVKRETILERRSRVKRRVERGICPAARLRA